jgi:hypothetical protein
VWIAANRVLYYPFRLPRKDKFLNAWVDIGAAVSGNIDIGVYSAGAGGPETKIASTGSTTLVGVATSARFTIDVTDFDLPAGLFYAAMTIDNITAAVIRTTGASAIFMRWYGWAQEAASIPLPATATPVVVASAYMPMFGWSTRAVP